MFNLKRRILLPLVACTAGLFSSVLPAAENPPVAQVAPAVKGEWSPLPFLPKETIGVFQVKDGQKALQSFQQTGLWKIYNDSDVQQALQVQMLMLQGGIMLAEQKVGFRLKDTIDLLSQGELTVAFIGLQDELNEKGEPIPDLLISYQPRGQMDAFQKQWQLLVDKFNQLTQNTLDIRRSTVGDTDIISISHAQFPTKIFYATCNGTFMASLKPGRIEQILSAKQSAEGGKAPEGTLGTSASYKSAMEVAGEGRDLSIYLNLETLRSDLRYKFQPKNDKERAGWQFMGLDKASSLSYSLSMADQFRESLFINLPKDQRAGGFWSLMDGQALSPRDFQDAPKNALAAFAFRLEPGAVLDRIRDAAGLENPQNRDAIDVLMTQWGQALNMDVKKDLIGAFDGTGSFCLAIPSKSEKLAIGMPQPVLRLGLTNEVAGRKAVEALSRMAADKFESNEILGGPGQMCVLREKAPNHPGEPFQLALGIKKNQLLISVFPLAVREEMERLNGVALQGAPTGVAATNSIAQDPDFQSSMGRISASPQAWGYVDVRSIALAVYDTLIPLAQIQRKGTQITDPFGLPTSKFLDRNLKGMAMAATAKDQGVLLESVSPTGMGAFLVVAGWAGERAKRRDGNQRPAEMDPNKKGEKPAPPPDF